MTLYSLKPRFQALLRPIVDLLADAGVTANQVTVAAALGSLAVGALVAGNTDHPALFLLLPVWLFLRMALNAIDGLLAREHRQASRLGALLNEIGDVVSDAALIAPFAFIAPFSPAAVFSVVVLAVMSEMAGILGQTIGASRRYDGPMGKSDRALLFGALGLWIGIAGSLPDAAAWLMPAAALLLVLTILNRLRAALAEAGPASTVPEAPADSPSPAAVPPPPAVLPGGRPVEEHFFRAHDGIDLFYRRWPATMPERQGIVILLHRGHEHSGRMAHLADELDLPGFDIVAWDARGHGLSPGPRGWSPSFGTLVRDLQSFVDHLRETHGVEANDIAVVAQSVGAVVAATWVHDTAPRIRALVLASPAFSIKLYVPFARAGLALLHRLRGEFFVTSYVKPRWLTHDPQRQASYAADPLVTRPIAVHILLGLFEAGRRVVQDAAAVGVPTQLLISGADLVVHQAPQHRFFERLGSAVKERHVLEGFYHDTLGEKDRAGAVARARAFVLARFAEPPAPHPAPALLAADRSGYTRDEADRLATPLAPFSLEGLRWSAARAALRAGGALSEGIALGHRTGFDSGATLDYVYRDEARGLGPLGRMADRAYLDAPGWAGIRERKRHVEELIGAAMRRLREEGAPVRILDIAAGHGRYVLDAIAGAEITPDSILLRDYDAANVAAGAALIAARGLADRARFERGDAFDGEDLAGITPPPTLAVVSGLYELYADNAPVRRSLAGLARAVPPGGLLVYTGQPWHPQLAFIARALTSHRGGQAWVMRRRTQGEMDALVEEAGFDKLEQRTGEAGIFTVALARRRGA